MWVLLLCTAACALAATGPPCSSCCRAAAVVAGGGRGRLLGGGHLPVHQGVVQEGVEDAQQRFLSASQHLQGGFAAAAEGALMTGHPEAVDQVLGQPKGHALRLVQGETPIEQAAKVHVHHLPGAPVHQQILSVAVAEAGDVADHGHDGGGAGEGQPGGVPGARLGPAGQEPAVHGGGDHGQHLVQQHRPRLVLGPTVIHGLDGGAHLAVGLGPSRVGAPHHVAQRLHPVHPLDQPRVLRQRRHRKPAHA
mmetsp:Transcript_17236/g.51597  ORF Transcript_17236/g.51597 Transcript_17236/m.51597 type:complete len:250 (-) Transcript_17236:702-1451(-)